MRRRCSTRSSPPEADLRRGVRLAEGLPEGVRPEGVPLSVVGLVPAAGRGERLGAGRPKALVELAGRPLLWHAVRGLLAAGCVDAVVVAAPPEHVQAARGVLAVLGGRVAVVAGGADRVASVAAALGQAPADTDVVLVHDAARCLTPASVIRAVVDAVRSGAPAVVPVLPVSDTLKLVAADGTVRSTVDRAAVRVVQTPQGFAADVLRRAHAAALGPSTDDAALVERIGIPVGTVAGHRDAFKITHPGDLELAELLLAARSSGSASGSASGSVLP